MTKIKSLLKKKNFPFFLLAAILNLFLILFVYRSVFSLELQGDTWQYGWGYQVAFGDSLLTSDSFRNLQTSLAGSYLTFALIKDIFGLSGLAYYSISVFLKFLTVISFLFLVYKLTNNKFASLVSSFLLSATYVGIEATHWVFNMYAYIGMLLIILGLTVALDLPKKFTLKKWLWSFFLVALGIWWGPMRTTGVIVVLIAWGLYKFVFLKTKDSRKNFLFWLISLPFLFLFYRTFLGLYEPAYTKYYIWDQWWNYFHQFLSQGKYDFLLSPASNAGRIILPDIWLSKIPFYKIFSPIFGLTFFRAVGLPLFLIFIFISFFFSKVSKIGTRLFHRMFILGFLWTAFVFVVYKQGPPNFPSWESLMFTLLGGYFLVWNIVFFTLGDTKTLLRDSFFFSFFWAFSFVLTPIVQNGGNTFSTLHRYFVITAASFPLFIAGVISQKVATKHIYTKALLIFLVFVMIAINSSFTKHFFDYKAKAHSREMSSKIWREFTEIVPNKPEYMKNNPQLWFEAKSELDREILFESLFFGLVFRIGLNYGWNTGMSGFYFENYDTLVSAVKENPTILDEFYAMRVEDGNLINISDEIKKDLLQKI